MKMMIGLNQQGGDELIEVLLCILMLAIIGIGAYYAAHYVLGLRMNRDMIADELKRATTHIEEMEDRVTMLEAERDIASTKSSTYRTEQPNSWSVMDNRN